MAGAREPSTVSPSPWQRRRVARPHAVRSPSVLFAVLCNQKPGTLPLRPKQLPVDQHPLERSLAPCRRCRPLFPPGIQSPNLELPSPRPALVAHGGPHAAGGAPFRCGRFCPRHRQKGVKSPPLGNRRRRWPRGSDSNKASSSSTRTATAERPLESSPTSPRRPHPLRRLVKTMTASSIHPWADIHRHAVHLPANTTAKGSPLTAPSPKR